LHSVIQLVFKNIRVFNELCVMLRSTFDPERFMTQTETSDIVQTLAQEADMPPETVAKMYDETLREFSEGAQVLDYVSLFTAKRVRARLRSASSGNGVSETIA
jgi:hypothetical protein